MRAGIPIIETMAGSASGILTERYIYEKVTGLPVYTPKELANHRQLTYFYMEHVDSKIPEEWALEVRERKGKAPEYRPTHDYDFKDKGRGLLINLTRLEVNTIDPIYQSASVMLSQISALFDSLSKKRLSPLRRGSVEGMFFAELAHWIIQKLPLMDLKTQRDLRKIINIRDYCLKVSANVLIPVEASGHNPIFLLELIIDNLNHIIEETQNLVLSNIFNARVERLNNAILRMASETFHIMYLMIQGEHDNETLLPVDLFLNEEQTYRPKIQTFKKQRLAYWLQKTLTRLGIERADFRTNFMIDLSEIDRYLEGECYGDRHLVLPPELASNPTHKSWGHWNFLIENHWSIRGVAVPVKTSEEMTAILRKTREVYRNILRIYYLHEFLKNLGRVNPMYGWGWPYGDSTGHMIVDEVLAMATEFSRGLMESLSRLFEEDIYKHLMAKVRTSSIGAEEQGFIAMQAAGNLYEGVKEYFQKAQEEIKIISTQISKYETSLTKVAGNKEALLEGLIRFLEYRGRQRTPVYDALKSALDASRPTTVARAAPAAEKAAAQAATPGGPGLFRAHIPAPVVVPPPQKLVEAAPDAATDEKLKQSAKCSIM